MYGTLEDFDKLAMEAKNRNIRVILDFVVNHTSDQHKWFLDSKSSKNAEHRDWYIWKDGEGPNQPPNNWMFVYVRTVGVEIRSGNESVLLPLFLSRTA